MYELTVERVFCAAHAIYINGQREPVHGHNWRVRMTVTGETLDANGLLCDFHVLERELDRVISRFDNANLNEVSPFDRVNPTAEAVARIIGQEVGAKLPRSVTLARIRLTEAPGCEAAWTP
jgi:6-pyruvoyltetrahydropterin/6-carboxytetrahydropterin synthase